MRITASIFVLTFAVTALCGRPLRGEEEDPATGLLADQLWYTSQAGREQGFEGAMVTEGIVGGFVPAHVRLQIVVVPQDGKHRIVVKKHADRRDAPAFLAGTLTEEQYEDLFAALDRQGLWKLPTEQPAGSEDIYRLDTSVAARRGANSWRNGGPAGCVHGQSKVKPSPGQIEQFTVIVGTIKKLADTHANDPSDADTFADIARQAQRGLHAPE